MGGGKGHLGLCLTVHRLSVRCTGMAADGTRKHFLHCIEHTGFLLSGSALQSIFDFRDMSPESFYPAAFKLPI
jgi:hypothetical protein